MEIVVLDDVVIAVGIAYILQGVPENLTYFVFELLHLKILSISYAKPLILTLTHRGKNEYS